MCLRMGMVANPARGQLNRKNVFPCPRSCLIIWFYETDSHTIAYQWRSLPRVRRDRTKQYFGEIKNDFFKRTNYNGCCLFRYHHEPIFMRLSFSTPTIIGM